MNESVETDFAFVLHRRTLAFHSSLLFSNVRMKK